MTSGDRPARGRGGRRVPLLDRMSADLHEQEALRPSTTVAMYATYAAHAAVTAAAVRRRWLAVPLPRKTARLLGAAMVPAGTALCVLGMGRFSGAGEISGTRGQDLVTDGVYRWSRNPQYVGYLVALAGLAVGRRSGAALATTGAAAGIFAAWVPREEAHLKATLGEPYRRYLTKTNRWWGRA